MRDLIFLFVDHFEPRRAEQTAAWVERYPKLAEAFRDAGGRPPQHTWFYDAEEGDALDALSGLCRRGLGEIELHLHHSHDTADGLREKLERRKRVYAEHGALITTDGVEAFGLIHGKWSLDNSRGGAHCGVNNELIVLREAGCYADFTFPAWGRMQPSKRNSIYYATDDPERPKSYDTGVDVEAGRAPSGDLMIFEGPGRLSGIPRNYATIPFMAWIADRVWGTCAVNAWLPPTPARIDRWVLTGVSVVGRPEWVFVKVHTHGAREGNFETYFGEPAQRLYRHLQEHYNDGATWRLHHATAREAYNIVKAAEAGESGNPEAYRDFAIKPYRNRA